MNLLTTYFARGLAEKKRDELQATAELQQQIEIAFELGRSSAAAPVLPKKHIMDGLLESLDMMGARIGDKLTEKEAFHLRGLALPATPRQMVVLKHFKVPGCSSLNKTIANYHIKRIFSDPANIEEWQQRPPTSMVLQGLLFMNGRLFRGMTQHEAQLKLNRSGVENPSRYREWKRIEYLFIAVNDQVIRQRNATRKITWKRFFHYYDELIGYGVPADEVTLEMFIARIISHQRSKALPLTDPIAGFSDLSVARAEFSMYRSFEHRFGEY